MRKILTTVISASALAGAVNTANAGGVFGDLINNVAPGVGTALDQANAAAGRPFDHAAAAFAEGMMPGAGTALEGAWAVQNAGRPGPAAPRPAAPPVPSSYYPSYGVPSSGPAYGAPRGGDYRGDYGGNYHGGQGGNYRGDYRGYRPQYGESPRRYGDPYPAYGYRR